MVKENNTVTKFACWLNFSKIRVVYGYNLNFFTINDTCTTNIDNRIDCSAIMISRKTSTAD